jgi:hypothetical protein
MRRRKHPADFFDLTAVHKHVAVGLLPRELHGATATIPRARIALHPLLCRSKAIGWSAYVSEPLKESQILIFFSSHGEIFLISGKQCLETAPVVHAAMRVANPVSSPSRLNNVTIQTWPR